MASRPDLGKGRTVVAERMDESEPARHTQERTNQSASCSADTPTRRQHAVDEHRSNVRGLDSRS